MSEKTCSVCGATKPTTAYQQRSRSHDGLSAACRDCCAARNRRYREANRGAVRERDSARRAARSPERKRAEWDRHYGRNRERIQANNKAWKEANPDKMRAIHRRRALAKYGITPNEYDAMFAEQGGGCAICAAEPGSKRNHLKPNLAVDHDHVTGAVRGLLCLSCNGALGVLGEDNLRSAMEYLGQAVIA